MDRRNFLKISSSTIGLSILGLSSSAQAFLNCTPFNLQGMQQCEVGIDSSLLSVPSSASGGQYLSQWCWAACLEMVFKYYGLNLSQEKIVKETWGGIENFPGQPRHIVKSLNRDWRNASRERFIVSGGVFY